MTALRPISINLCTAQGCENKLQIGSAKYCSKHLWRLKKWGTLERTLVCCICGESFHLVREALEPNYCPNCRPLHNNAVYYGISGLEWVEMAKDQQWSCAICLTHVDDFTLVTDHDHETGKVRGLLCSGCNLMLGMVKDSPIHLISAAVYLQRHGKLALKKLNNATS